MTAKPEPTRSDRMHDIEGRHLGRCLDQLWGTGRRTLVELMDFPKAGCQAVVVKVYEGPVPRSSSGKPWPDLQSAYVYVPVEDAGMTWDGLDKALEAFAAKHQPPTV